MTPRPETGQACVLWLTSWPHGRQRASCSHPIKKRVPGKDGRIYITCANPECGRVLWVESK